MFFYFLLSFQDFFLKLQHHMIETNSSPNKKIKGRFVCLIFSSSFTIVSNIQSMPAIAGVQDLAVIWSKWSLHHPSLVAQGKNRPGWQKVCPRGEAQHILRGIYFFSSTFKNLIKRHKYMFLSPLQLLACANVWGSSQIETDTLPKQHLSSLYLGKFRQPKAKWSHQ